MRLSDYIEQSFCNLWKKKLRTFLTTCGVVIGIGALVCMFAFGKGMQKKLTETFNELGLFNYVAVSPSQTQQSPVLDDEFLRSLADVEGVEWALPEIRFPAMIRFRGEEEFSLVQVLPTDICQAGFIKLREGEFYRNDDENALVISDSLLRRANVKKPETVIGENIEVCTLVFDLSPASLPNLLSFIRGQGLPFTTRSYTFTICGVAERMGMSGPMPIRSDVFIPHGTAQRMKKIPLTSISDIFKSIRQSPGYSSVGIKLSSPKYVEPVKTRMEQMGFETFAMLDQLEEIKTGFLFVDMFLFAVGMIGITVAALGIINTMVMSILERYREIGIMKAIGASDKDVKKIFFFESGVIGFLGGIFGLTLGWLVSMLINLIVNSFAVRQGVPYMNYFSFPWWLCLGAIVFSISISLLAGIYPTLRAARVDPVVALRHD
ncbi:MAG: ABC transporter permease [Phycisphaerales bacterium]|nr:MAG: ABC transporter permease [Phycisphaerales bacterium]